MRKKKDPLALEQGRRIKADREAHNLSQAQLGRLLGVVQGTIGNWESGAQQLVDARIARKLGEMFNKPAGYYLADLSEEETLLIVRDRLLRKSREKA